MKEGTSMEKKKKKMPTWLIIVLVVLGIAVIGNIISSEDTEKNDSSENRTVKKEEKRTTTKKEKFSVVEGTEKGYADDYGFAYYIEGTVKNNTDKKYSYIQISYNVYDADGNNLGSCLANNNNLAANETWKFKAICSGDTKNIASYKLDEITGW